MKKAIIVGGSGRFGKELIKNLKDEYKIIVYGIHKPEDEEIEFHYLNFLDFNEHIFDNYINDEEVKYLAINPGKGRYNSFNDILLKEIEEEYKVNVISQIKILKIFYPRIYGDKDFYTSVVTSVSGKIPQANMSIYSATKCSLSHILETLNFELSSKERPNRILDICLNKTNYEDIEEVKTKLDLIKRKLYNKEEIVYFNKIEKIQEQYKIDRNLFYEKFCNRKN